MYGTLPDLGVGTLLRCVYLDRHGIEHRLEIRTSETREALLQDARELGEGIAAALWHRQCDLLAVQLVGENLQQVWCSAEDVGNCLTTAPRGVNGLRLVSST